MNKYAVTSPSRKDLVRRIAALTGLVPVYTRVPRCAYVIGSYAVEKDGVMNVEEGADMSVISTLIQEGMIAGDSDQEEPEAQPAEETMFTAEPEAQDEPILSVLYIIIHILPFTVNVFFHPSCAAPVNTPSKPISES